MANKKITELNEATSISNNDWLVMVDVANDETKKIHAGEVGGNIPIQDTAPQNPEENDLWIDTSGGEGTNIVDLIFPVGSIVIKADNEDYSNWLGFTWERTLVGRVAVGIDTTQTEFDTIGETGGEKTHTLTTQEMPSHNHMEKIYSKNYNDNKSLSGNRAYARSFADVTAGWNYTVNGETSGQIVDLIETGNTGGGQAHNNLQPYQVVAYWKRIS